jgi:hypothetical protein
MAGLSRRNFLRALPAAPSAAKAIAKAAVAEAAVATGAAEMAAAGVNVSSFAGAAHYGHHLLSDPKMYALHKAGLLPDWVKREIANEIKAEARTLSTNIASLQSVSLSAKVAINERELERKFWSKIDAFHVLNAQRSAYWSGEGGN